MPNLPHSRAAERVSARIASFDDAYGAYPTAPSSAAFEPMVTMRPRPWSRMCGNTACIPQSVPLGPVFSSTSMSCSVISANGVTDRNVCAFATRPSTRPNSAMVRSTSANAPSRSATLSVVDRCGAPMAASSAAVSSSASGLRAVITSDAPLRARCRAMPRPTPFDAPVTMTTCPSTEFVHPLMCGTSRRRARRGRRSRRAGRRRRPADVRRADATRGRRAGTTSAAMWGVSGGRNQRTVVSTSGRPSVSSQFAVPGSRPATTTRTRPSSSATTCRWLRLVTRVA